MNSDHKEVTLLLRDPTLRSTPRKRPPLYAVLHRSALEFHDELKRRVERVVGRAVRCTAADFDWDRCVEQLQRAIRTTTTDLRERDRMRQQAARRRRNHKLAQMSGLAALRAEIQLNSAHLAQQVARRRGAAQQRGGRPTVALYRRVSARSWDQGITRLVSSEFDFRPDDNVAECLRKAWQPLLARHAADMDAFQFEIPADRRLDVHDAHALTTAVTTAEIAMVTADIAAGKRAGPDGLSNDFFKRYGTTLLPVLEREYNRILDGGACPPSFAAALIFPIRKNGDSTNPKDYRPISLLNSSYKIFARLLARRLAPYLPRLVGPVQNGFVRGRRMQHSVDTMLAALLLQHDGDDTTPPDDDPCVILRSRRWSPHYPSHSRRLLDPAGALLLGPSVATPTAMDTPPTALVHDRRRTTRPVPAPPSAPPAHAGRTRPLVSTGSCWSNETPPLRPRGPISSESGCAQLRTR